MVGAGRRQPGLRAADPVPGLPARGSPIVGWCYADHRRAPWPSSVAERRGRRAAAVAADAAPRPARAPRARHCSTCCCPSWRPAPTWRRSPLIARLWRAPDGFSAALFLAVTLGGFAAAAVACAGPILAMQRLRPRGPAVQLAARAAGVAAAGIVVAAAASGVAAIGLGLWARGFAAYHQARPWSAATWRWSLARDRRGQRRRAARPARQTLRSGPDRPGTRAQPLL